MSSTLLLVHYLVIAVEKGPSSLSSSDLLSQKHRPLILPQHVSQFYLLA